MKTILLSSLLAVTAFFAVSRPALAGDYGKDHKDYNDYSKKDYSYHKDYDKKDYNKHDHYDNYDEKKVDRKHHEDKKDHKDYRDYSYMSNFDWNDFWSWCGRYIKW